MEKYELTKKGTDDWTLKYKDKEISFKTDVELKSKAQSIQKQARVKMIMDLSKQGISVKDLTMEEKKDGKTYLDNTNKEELEKVYLEEATTEFFNNAFKEKIGITMEQLVEDIGLVTEKEGLEFGAKMIEALSGQKADDVNFPSR